MKKSLFPLIPLILVLIVLLVCLPGQKLDAQGTQGPPKIDSDPQLSPGDFYLPGHGQEQPAELDPAVTNDSFNYTMLTFMGLRDQNWEIITSDGRGNYVTRRTHHGASDITPRFNYGATRIAFSSNRSGNYEIYTMTRWGTDVRRLTNNGSGDSNPSWSRDGTKILFDTDRDGQREIYRMNADGSGQTRLTYDGAYDGQANYSPDGSKIVFTSRRNGYGIWVMNADGSNPTQLVWRRFSQNPVWSPHGTMIAYDADNNGNDWQEIWVMNADGSNQRQLYAPGGSVDPYVRSWSPDSRYIAFTYTQWISYQGNWYWTMARPSYMDLNGYSSYFSYELDEDWYPDWQVTDIFPPETMVSPLPTYSGDEVTVSWSGSDPGGSGIQNYDVQYRVDQSGTWQDWQVDTTYTSRVFGSLPGKTVYFRSRATDNAGQTEEWPAGDGDAHTTFYTWKISGTAMDNRLIPLPGMTVTTTQTYFEILPSDDAGAYGAYFASYDLNYGIGFFKEGYGAPASTEFPRSQEGNLDVLLPPADNILADPDFEAAAFSSENWMSGGLYSPTLDSDQRHTGEQSLFLGLRSDLETVAHFEADVKFTDKTAPRQDATGQFHAVWHVYNPAGGRFIYYAAGDGDGNWSAPVSLAPFTTNVADLHWDVSADGHVHVIWEDNQSSYDAIYHAWMDDSGWHDPQIVYNIGRVELNGFQLDSQNAGHLLWYLSSSGLNDTFYSYVNSTGTWVAPERLFQSSYRIDEFLLDSADQVHLLWGNQGSAFFYNYQLPGGGWSAVEQASDRRDYNWDGVFILDENEEVHLVWGNASYGRIYHARRNPGGGWSGPAYISEGTDPDSRKFELMPQPGGALSIVWRGGDYSCRQLFHASIDASGSWTSTDRLNIGSECTNSFWLRQDEQQRLVLAQKEINQEHQICQMVLVLDEAHSEGQCLIVPTADYGYDSPYPLISLDGLSHFFWRKNVSGGGMGLMHSRTKVNETAGESQVSQEMTIPAEMVNPTLSFVYWQGLNGNDEDLSLQVSVADNLQTTTFFTGTRTAGWTYEWVDLSPWSGQDLTVSFSVKQKAGAVTAWAYVDEAFLGSAFPDLWTTISGPQAVSPGDNLILTLDFGNSSSAPAEGSLLTVTLPPELSYSSAVPTPLSHSGSQVVWDVGDLSVEDGLGSIILTTAVSETVDGGVQMPVTATLSSESPEINEINNTDQVMVLVTLRTFLPVLLR